MAEGVWYIGGAGANSVAVEFRDFVAVVESPTNEERSIVVIDEVHRLVPNKPIRYLVNTHHHFDHLGGIRTFVAEGATIITHERNRDFYERVVFSPAPRTLQPDRLSLTPRAPVFETLNERYALSDGTRVMEIYAVPGLAHNQNMLIAYLPKEKILVEGDLFTPPAPGAPSPPVNASNRTFRDTVQRLKLDVAQIASIHGRVAPWDEFTKVIGTRDQLGGPTDSPRAAFEQPGKSFSVATSCRKEPNDGAHGESCSGDCGFELCATADRRGRGRRSAGRREPELNRVLRQWIRVLVRPGGKSWRAMAAVRGESLCRGHQLPGAGDAV